ncbi:MAG: alpha/beta fold hydrolase [Verrucomicrobia bacterium]|nr:alpha/beta fold hydrolase [Verrucomicrobiota bacterium]
MPEKKLTLPRMGETMNEGTIVGWLKQPGEHFRRGETLLEVESDKINVDIPALEDGEMVLHLVLAGEKVAVDHPIAVVQTFELSPPSPNAGESQPTLQTNVAPKPEIQSNEDRPLPVAGAKIRASPAARRVARELGVNLPEIKGTGPRGRVTGTDVRRHATLSVKPAGSTVADSSGQPFRWGKPQRGTCFLLHGFAGDPTTWRRTGEFLAEQGFEAMAFELPGHGSLPVKGASLDELVAEVISGLPSPLNGKFHLVGHSLGGAIAILIAARDPGRVASLTLLAPIGIGTYINQSFLDGIVSAGTSEALERELRKTTGRPLSYAKSALAAMLESRREDGLRTISRMMAQDGVQQLFLVPELEKITAPVRVFFGRQDKILHWQEALSLPGKIALHLFDTGHMAHWEDPSEVLPVLGRFPASS